MNNSKIKYSLVIPHFNDESGLRRLLSSIPPRKDIQVLVIDDRSSTKEFKNIVAKSGLPNIKTFVNEGIKSAGTCRNIGLKHAVGEYLVFADADDFFADKAFAYIDKAIDSNPGSDVYFFNVTSLAENGELGTRHIKNRELVLNYLNKKPPNYDERLRLTHNVPWGKVIRKKLVDKNKIYFDQTVIANDGIFSLRVGQLAKQLTASRDIIYCVTSSLTSLTGQKDITRYRVRLEVYVRYFHLLSKEERKKINASPIPLIYLSLSYGFVEFFRTIIFLRKNNVNILKYFRFRRRYIARIAKS